MPYLKYAFLTAAALTAGSEAGPLKRRAATGYQLQDSYDHTNFFDGFDFFTDNDPTNGFVNYVSRDVASQNGYIFTSANSIRIGVDDSSVITNLGSVRGRDSVRISTTKAYRHGLVVADIQHMPGGICGTWPAFWMLGPNWPAGGELDIMEGINSNTVNLMSLHTSDNCLVSSQSQLATATTQNCYVYASGQTSNAGCQSTSTSTQTYGQGFNANGGGVWAVEWTSEFIKIWFFPHGSEPSDLSNGSPDPTSNAGAWGTPQAWFQGSCDLDSHFGNLNMIFDTTFCGDYAGNDLVWTGNGNSGCAASTGYSSCQSYVAAKPGDFTQAYWEINSLKYFSPGQASTPNPIASSAASNAPIAGSSAVGVSPGPPSIPLPGVSEAPLAPTNLPDIGPPAQPPLPPPPSLAPLQGGDADDLVIVHVVTFTTSCPWTCVPEGYNFPTIYPTLADGSVTTWRETLPIGAAGPGPTDVGAVIGEPPSGMEGIIPSLEGLGPALDHLLSDILD